jgi:hypothetical protein
MGFRRSKDAGLALSSGGDTGLALNNKDITLHAEIEKDAQEELDSHLEAEVKTKPQRMELDSNRKSELKTKPQRPSELEFHLEPKVKPKPQRLELDPQLKSEVKTKPQRTSKPAKPEPKVHDHMKAHRPIKFSKPDESEKPEPSRQSQPYQQSYAKTHPKSTSGPMFADIEAPDRLSDTATSAVTALILLCVFLVWGWKYQARQRTFRAEKEISVIIDEICGMSSTLCSFFPLVASPSSLLLLLLLPPLFCFVFSFSFPLLSISHFYYYLLRILPPCTMVFFTNHIIQPLLPITIPTC